MDNINTPGTPPNQGNMMPPRALPNATAVLVLGIVSIVGCCCYGILGIISGIIAMVLAGKDTRLYNLNPAAYTASSYSNIKTGKILAIIGLVLSVLYMIYSIYLISIIGISGLSDPEQIREMIEQIKGQ